MRFYQALNFFFFQIFVEIGNGLALNCWTDAVGKQNNFKKYR